MLRDRPAGQHFMAWHDHALLDGQAGQQAGALDQHQQLLPLGLTQYATALVNRQIAPPLAHTALYRPCLCQFFLLADGDTYRVLATGVGTAGW
ncbi:hypothetical protein D3C80_1949850 [compost metagenome]